jgi:hypothetical protein
MYLLFIWGGTFRFGLGEIHNEERLKGWALKSRKMWQPWEIYLFKVKSTWDFRCIVEFSLSISFM